MWLARSNGQYWPSSHQTLQSEGTALIYDKGCRRLFVGTGSGEILVSCAPRRTFKPISPLAAGIHHQPRLQCHHIRQDIFSVRYLISLNTPSFFQHILHFTGHSARIEALLYDKSREIILSLSRDKHLRIFSSTCESMVRVRRSLLCLEVDFNPILI